MSDRLKSTLNVSNEEVIEDLTKDLELALRSGDDGDFVVSPGSRAEDFQPSAGDSARESHPGDIPLSDEDPDKTSKAESDKEDSDTDSIDSVSLKDAEVELTEDQKEERRVIAETLKVAGNEAYRVAEYEKCIEKYTEALRLCPLKYSEQRSILYCNRSAAKMKLEKYKKAIKDCTKAIELDDKYLKAYYRRAQCYEATDKLDECLADYKKILELDPSHKEAKTATLRLPAMIEERNEKLKTEMLGKLKDLGNMILKPFGLSTENFQLEQDSESKGYKINFKQ
ncbi:tetratricopeptide repeat protein 1-like [Maniola jurtina]|uniref:tetratricopeptide repeat protein 1-like n=1 Tax=Maniola jurtina TaxID=191418 RepID=UPI001E68D349|nr:tetratricopeptide repeat protein 1-like [Maniola jurtina]XP_045782185.1 tetratricopeptide repeat protein 1-like [Maniola jurtina]XP_045782186.1 tetratricopeptide repeat protein 1-like [Maniola jurtina]